MLQVDPVVTKQRPPAQQADCGFSLLVVHVVDAREFQGQRLRPDRNPYINRQLLGSGCLFLVHFRTSTPAFALRARVLGLSSGHELKPAA